MVIQCPWKWNNYLINIMKVLFYSSLHEPFFHYPNLDSQLKNLMNIKIKVFYSNILFLEKKIMKISLIFCFLLLFENFIIFKFFSSQEWVSLQDKFKINVIFCLKKEILFQWLYLKFCIFSFWNKNIWCFLKKKILMKNFFFSIFVKYGWVRFF